MSNPGAEAIEFFRNRYNIDSAAMSSLLSIALSRGGDFAELFFEHRTNSAIQWEDQRVKSASRNVAQGVGIRVVKGDAIGYAYTESLDMEAMRRAAETASRIGTDDERPTPTDATPYLAGEGSFYSTSDPLTDAPAARKVALLERADAAARAFDSTIARVDASIGDELKYVMVARSDGKVVGDVQPLVRFNVSALSQDGEARQIARTGGGGRMGMDYFERVTPEELAREAARQAVLLQAAIEAPAGTFPVVLAAGDSGILLHEAIGHGLEADFNRKKTSNYSDRVGESSPARSSPSSTTARSPTAAAPSTSTTRATRHAQRPHRRRHPPRLPPGPDQLAPLRRRALRQRPPPVLQALPHAAHDQHLHAGRREHAGRDHPRRRPRHLLRLLLRRPGQHQQRRLRLLRHRGLHDRGRQGHVANPQRQPHRQRPRRALQGHRRRQRLPALRRPLDLRQGRPVRPRRRRHADGARHRHHGRRHEGLTSPPTPLHLVERGARTRDIRSDLERFPMDEARLYAGRHMRKNATASERVLWEALKGVAASQD